MDLSKFEALETRVSGMLDKLGKLTRQKEELEENLMETQDKLSDTAKELEAAESLISEMQAEREAILAKVDAILGRLE